MTNAWYDKPDPTGLTDTGERGLRFECTLCGACCTGPPGYVLFTDEEADAIASFLGVTRAEFEERWTHETPEGRSLIEKKTSAGFDCIFLDRTAIPGKAVCGIYEHRPAQCRTWPFWADNLRSSRHWDAAARGCPGINRGPLHSPGTIRLTVERDNGARRR